MRSYQSAADWADWVNDYYTASHLSANERARLVVEGGKISLNAQLCIFTVAGTSEPRVVRLLPTSSCSCPAKANCYHIKAAEMAVGIQTDVRRRKINLTQLRRNKRKRADNMSGRKQHRLDNVHVLPAGDVEPDDLHDLETTVRETVDVQVEKIIQAGQSTPPDADPSVTTTMFQCEVPHDDVAPSSPRREHDEVREPSKSAVAPALLPPVRRKRHCRGFGIPDPGAWNAVS